MSATVAAELRNAAADSPEQIFLRTTHEELTYAQTDAAVSAYVIALREAGIGPGDGVALMMRTDIPQALLWFALNALGALHAGINPDLKGAALVHALNVAGAGVLIVDGVGEAPAREAAQVVHGPVRVLNPRELRLPAPRDCADASPTTPVAADPLATATLLFTSGTTGPAKACALSHRYLIRQGQLHAKHLELRSNDVLYCPFPLFHIDAATLTVSAALSVRATAALGPRFSASGFWDEVRSVGATVFNFMGATLTMLWKRPPTAQDRDHQVRLAWGVPMPEWQSGFEERFGVPLRQIYGLTDAGIPAYDPVAASEQRPGRAGRVIEEYDVNIDVSQSREGDPAGVGEILVRGREPGLVMTGYYGNPKATAATIVDGWVRTGDLGALDKDGFLSFHGRLSDSIRRRGQNISAFEVEEVVTSHPEVVEACAVGVPSELSEEDVLVCVVRRAGSALDADELVRHCLAHGPRHLAPRYVRFLNELPKTPTEKVQKTALRTEAVTADTRDVERHYAQPPLP
ncbi:MAG: AMP-binding protein [Ornithinimicrobium sp.]